MGSHCFPRDLPGAVALVPGGRGGTWYCLELEADAAEDLASALLPLPRCFGPRFQGADAAAFDILRAGLRAGIANKRQMFGDQNNLQKKMANGNRWRIRTC